MLSSKRNLIHGENIDKHDIKRYEFKSINEAREIDGKKKEYSPVSTVQEEAVSTSPSLEKELIEKLLTKSDELSGNLAKLEIQFEKTQTSMQDSIEKTSEESYKRGLEEGKNKARAELESAINDERDKIVQSLIALENALKNNQTHLETLEKELSGIAIDMAKEVIIKEIDDNSQKVALELTKSLLANIMDATQIYIRVNPTDYVYIKENLKNIEKIQLEADNAISRGGVVISSNLGNLDGSIMSRYKMLKQSVIDNLRE